MLAVPAPDQDARPSTASSRPSKRAAAPLLERVATALSCPGPRHDIVDILAGAPYEFFRSGATANGAKQEFQAFSDRLPQLVHRVMKEKHDVGATWAETELQETVLQLAATGGGWPAALRQRLLAALEGPCEPKCSGISGAASPINATALEVDMSFTSSGTVSSKSGWIHQTLLSFGAATGIPTLRRRAEHYKSRPATVVVSPEPIAPRDCFALRGNASVALQVAGPSRSAVIRHLVMEQLPHWVAPKLWSLPGRFEVWGEPAGATADAPRAKDPYTLLLGSFEYVAAGPAPQAFELQNSVPVHGLRISFKEPVGRGPENFFCIYRLRAFETKAPSCTEATSKSPARLAAIMQ